MKQYCLLAVSLLVLSVSVNAQKFKWPGDLKKADCLTGSNKAKATSTGDFAEDTALLKFEFTDAPAATGSDKKYLIKNFITNATTPGKLDGNILSFDVVMGSGVEELYLQLIDAADKTCYNWSAHLTQTFKGTRITLPKLNLEPYTIGTDPCNSCAPQGNKVIYNFSDNSLRNERITAGNSRRTFVNDYLQRRWINLPNVGQELTFEVTNVNPFKYDITLTDEAISFNTEAPSFLTAAFTPKDGINAAADGTKKKVSDSLTLLEALENLDTALNSKLTEFRNAGDCFNPCTHITKAVGIIVKYFEANLGYKNQGNLESFLTTLINQTFDPEKDSAKIKELNDIVKKYYDFRNSAVGTFSYRIPQLKNVDQYLFKLNITPKEGVKAGARVLNQDIAVDVLGGFKVDVTSGLFFTKLVDERYLLRGDSTVIRTSSGYADSIIYNRRNKVIRENGSNWDFGVAAFFHFYPKITSRVNLSFTLGAGTSLSEKPKLRYLAGGTLLIGKTNRIGLTYGVAMGFAEQLSDRYNDQKDAQGNIYTSQADTKIDMKKYFKTSSFIALTYSIPLVKKKEEVKAAPAAEEAKPAEADKPAEETKPAAGK